MATINEFRTVIVRLMTEPHAVSLARLSSITGIPVNKVADIIDVLIVCNYVKPHRDNSSLYFTRKPKREELRAFTLGGLTLGNIVFDPSCCDYRTVLSTIRNARHSVSILGFPAEINEGLLNRVIDDLLEANIIKEHVEHSGHFFTRKPKRELVDHFLSDNATVEELLGTEATATEESTEVSTQEPCGSIQAARPILTVDQACELIRAAMTSVINAYEIR